MSRRDVSVSRMPWGTAEERDGPASRGSIMGADEGPAMPSASVWLDVRLRFLE